MNRSQTSCSQAVALESAEPESRTTQPGRTWWAAVALVSLLAVLVVLFNLGGYRTLTSHEGFVGVVSRDMLASGDWVVPRFAGLPRLKKPPLAYWVAAVSATVCGQHNEWTVRLPSALAALALAGLMGWWAARRHGRNVGLAAAMIQISTVAVIGHARLAEVDMLLCLLTTSALLLAAMAPAVESHGRAFVRWTVFSLLVGLSWLAKFHYGPAMVLSVVGLWQLKTRCWRPFLFMANPLSLAIVAGLVCAWPWMLLSRVPEAWEIWQAETVGRAIGVLGRQPVWFYIPQTIVMTLPWAPLLVRGIPESWRRAWRTGDLQEQFLWLWFGVHFVILTASAFKHHHYLLAAVPALTVPMARVLVRLVEQLNSGRLRVSGRLAGFSVFAYVLGGVAAPLLVSRKWPGLLPPALVAGLLVAAGGSLVAVLLWRGRLRFAAVAGAVVFAGCYMAVMGWIIPGRDSRRATVDFAARVARQHPAEEVVVFGLKEHPVLYYLPQSATRVEDPEELARQLRQSRQMLVISDDTVLAELLPAVEGHSLLQVTVEGDCPRPKGLPLQLYRLHDRQPAAATATTPASGTPRL